MLYCKIQGSTIYIYTPYQQVRPKNTYMCVFGYPTLPVLGSQKPDPTPIFFLQILVKKSNVFFVFRSIVYCNVTTIYAIGTHIFFALIQKI